jgi:O-antigen/teichoic acid export membrane protein
MTSPTHLTASATMARGTAWNIAGRVGPLLLALAATPFLVETLGVARWGFFALALSLAGMFGIFDLGIGRALTRLVAEGLGRKVAGIEGAVLAGLLLLAGLGAVAGLAAAAGAWAYAGLLDVPAALREELRWAMAALALSAPLVLLNAGMWGVLAAHQDFAAANKVNLRLAVLYYLGPLAALQVWDHLAAATLVLGASRAAMAWAYWRLCRAALPGLGAARPDPRTIRPLLRQGGWITVSNIVWPVSEHLDRFIIAARLSAEAAAWYATPFDLVIRIAVLGQAVVAGAFPAMSTALASSAEAAGRLFRHAVLGIAAMVLPPCLACLLLAETLLTLWLGEAFAAQASVPMRILAAGVVLHALDGVATALIDGAGRSARNAALAVAELALYLPLLLALLATAGIAGAAAAWSARALVTLGARLALARGAVPALRPVLTAIRPLLVAIVLALAAALALAFALPEEAVLPRLGLAALLPLPCAWLAWRHALTGAEHTMLAAGLAEVARRGRLR